MQSGFTKKAEEALHAAAEAAFELGHGSVGSEHILLGLLRTDESMAQSILWNNNVKEERVIEIVNQLIAPDRTVGLAEPDHYTPRASRILDNARREAKRFHAQLIGTEHILIGMIKEPESVATRLLSTMNISIQKIYVDLMVAMGEDSSSFHEEMQQKKQKIQDPDLGSV